MGELLWRLRYIGRRPPRRLPPPPSTLEYGVISCDKVGSLFVGNTAYAPIEQLSVAKYTDVGNYNLLDNTNFTNLINQRGELTYSGSWGYSIDRWVLLGEFNVSTNTFKFDYANNISRFGLDAISYMRQGVKSLEPGTYTISAKLNNVVYSKSLTVGDSALSQAWNVGPFYFTYEKFLDVDTWWFGFGLTPNVSFPDGISLDWIKLEKGNY